MKSSRLIKFLKPYWLWTVLAPLLMVLEVAMDLMQPRMIQRIVDEGIAQFDMTVVVSTGLLMIVYALIGAVGGLCAVMGIITAAEVVPMIMPQFTWMFWFVLSAILILASIALSFGRGYE